MKIFTSISLLILILVGASKDISVYVDYVINQDEIVNNLCINKDKPIVMCYGQCYIDSQLQENQDSQKDNQIQLESKINYIVELTSMNIEEEVLEIQPLELIPSTSSLFNSPWDDSHFRPPSV